MKEYVLFEYQYRDASSYKAFGNILLEGTFGEDRITELRSHLDRQEFFIPEYVGIPALRSQLYKTGVPNADDHQYHDFTGIRAPSEEEMEKPGLWGTVEDLVSAMKAASRRWLI